MAIYHFSGKIVSRSTGRSVVAAAAYRSGSRLTDERTGKVFDYRRKSAVVHSEILAPAGSPAWALDREQLWNAVEACEKRKDAQLAREFEIALPRELSPEARIELLRGFVRQEFVSRGMIADMSIHCPKAADGLDAPHAHVLLTLRPTEGDQFGKKAREWNDVALLEGWRKQWSDAANAALDRAASSARIDHRTLAAQRQEALTQARAAQEAGERAIANHHARRAEALNRPPEPKLGATRRLAEQAGVMLDRLAQWHRARAIREVRQHFAALGQSGIRKLEQQIAARIAQDHQQRRTQDHTPPEPPHPTREPRRWSYER